MISATSVTATTRQCASRPRKYRPAGSGVARTRLRMPSWRRMASTTASEVHMVNQAPLLNSATYARVVCAWRRNAILSSYFWRPSSWIERMEEMCSSRKAFHAIRSCCTESEPSESFFRKRCLTTRNTGTRGRIVRVSIGLSTDIVTIVKIVVRTKRKIAGRRSEPK